MAGEWFEAIPETLTIEDAANGTKIPAREHPWIKESPDLGHFVNKSLETHREVGSRIPLKIEQERNADGTFKPKAESVKAWRDAHLEKLYAAGVLGERPPAKPEEYGIAKPESIPSNMFWSDERAAKLASVLHKYGVPKAAVPELMELHAEALLQGQKIFQGTFEDGITELKREFGDKYDELAEDAKRLMQAVVKNPAELELLEATGIGNAPWFISMFMRLAPLAMQDASMGLSRSGGPQSGVTADSVRAEVADIMSNPNNPKHAGYHRNEPAVMQYIDELYKKAYGTEQVSL